MLLQLGDSMQQSLLTDMYSPLLSQISLKHSVTKVNTARDALRSIQSAHPPSVILCVDGGISKVHFANFHRRLARYVIEDGGALLFGLLFSSFVRPPDLNAIFRAFELDWSFGDYHRTTFSLNQASTALGMLGDNAGGLEAAYSMKSVHLKGVPNEAKLNVPTEESQVESLVFPPRLVDTVQSPAVYARCGKGRIGFIGDVNKEEGSRRLILAMLGEPVA